MPVLQRELISLVVEINKSAPILSGLHLSDPGVGRFLGGGALLRYINFDTLRSISSMGTNDSVGHLGSHLVQASTQTIIFVLSLYFNFVN